MAKIETVRSSDFQYLLINTGYTSRIVPGGSRHEEFFERIHENIDDDEEKLELIFAVDALWGTGLYEVGKDKEEVSKMIELTKTLNLYEYGIACFKCKRNNYRHIIDAVEENIYCSTFGMEVNIIYKTDNKSDLALKYIEWDSESG